MLGQSQPICVDILLRVKTDKSIANLGSMSQKRQTPNAKLRNPPILNSHEPLFSAIHRLDRHRLPQNPAGGYLSTRVEKFAPDI